MSHLTLKKILYSLVFLLSLNSVMAQGSEEGWISLFDGKTLKGWKVGDNASSFHVEDGSIVVNGPKAHLYYMGDVKDHNFKNFEFKTKVMTRSGSNSGIYFHTEYQEKDWPDKGFEVQVNNSHTDYKRTGGLYNVQEVLEVYVGDDEWFTESIKVVGQRVIIMINDIVVIDYTEPANPLRSEGNRYRLIDRGTFAFQAHDPKSTVYFKDIMVRPLPE